MRKQAALLIILLFTFCATVYAQKILFDSSKRCYIGSSAFMLGNLFPNPPSFYQLNFGYWLTRKDVVSVEAITWRYGHPLGIPYGTSYDAPEEAYPGYVRGNGLGVAYQHYFWKGLYTSAHAIAFSQKYLDKNKVNIQNGFQLYLIFRTGYHIEFFKHRFFIEPSIAANYWPVNINRPADFAASENKWPNYFLLEPGLHFGFKF